MIEKVNLNLLADLKKQSGNNKKHKQKLKGLSVPMDQEKSLSNKDRVILSDQTKKRITSLRNKSGVVDGIVFLQLIDELFQHEKARLNKNQNEDMKQSRWLDFLNFFGLTHSGGVIVLEAHTRNFNMVKTEFDTQLIEQLWLKVTYQAVDELSSSIQRVQKYIKDKNQEFLDLIELTGNQATDYYFIETDTEAIAFASRSIDHFKISDQSKFFKVSVNKNRLKHFL